MKNKLNFDNLLLTIYTYIVTAFLGWQFFSFSNIFFQINQKRILFSFQQWMDVQYSYFPIVGFILCVLLVLLMTTTSIKQKQYPINYLALKYHLLYLAILIVGVLINYILHNYGIHQNIIELINLIAAIFSLSHLSKLFYVKTISVWFHPSTLSTFYLSAVFLGISQLIIFEIITYPFAGYAYFLLILLVIEVLRIFTRFKYLTKYSYETKMIARSLLGKYGIYFGVRLVAGIFMPFVYIIYALYTNAKLFQGVGALIIIGEFIERLLYIYLSDFNTKQAAN